MNHIQIIEELQQKIETVLNPILPPNTKLALLDFPSYPNVGDSAIWVGEMEYFKKRKLKIAYSCTVEAYSKERLLKKIGERGIILISGGGNFGDLWERHQLFREKVICDFPNHRIVQLSQSIHFKDKQKLERAKSIINEHFDFYLLVRDKESYKLARETFSAKLVLCPDMAFMLGSLTSFRRKAKKNVFALIRTDKESINKINQSSFSALCDFDPQLAIVIQDWDTGNNTLNRIQTALCSGFDSRFEMPTFLKNEIARLRLLKGINQLSQGDAILTDRLHGYILSLLLNIPHIFLDNSYGKLSAFYDTWLKESELTFFEKNFEKALDKIRRGVLKSPL